MITVTSPEPPAPPVVTTKPTRKRKLPTMTKAFFNTIAPGLSSLATSSTDADNIKEEDQHDTEFPDAGPELDPDVVATIADF